MQGMADAFPGSVLVFDAANRTAVKMTRQNMAQERKNQGRGRIFLLFRTRKSELSMWDSRFAGHKPRLYAGLHRFERPIRQQIFPFSRKGRRRYDENADCKDQLLKEAF